MFKTTSRKKLVIGLVLFAVILAVFLSFNRLPKLDTVGGDLDAITAPDIQCFQGFCIERDPGTSFFTQWWVFTLTYLRLVTIGMTFAFLVAGLTEAFLFPSGSGKWFTSGGLFKRTIKGMAVGPVMNLCSACIVPISAAFRRRGVGIEGAIAMVQGSATMNIPALAMVFFVFTPMLGFSRLILALAGALLIGPLVVMAVNRGKEESLPELDEEPIEVIEVPESSWKPALIEGFRDWAKFSLGYLIRMGPIMILAGAASGLAVQWLSPETVSDYLGNTITGVIIAATLGVMINVPLLFEIPLVALLLLLGMGTAPAATLLFTAAAGGPMTFWGLSKVMPRKAIGLFATATWTLGLLGGLVILGLGVFIWEQGNDGISEELLDRVKAEAGVGLNETVARDAVELGDGPLLDVSSKLDFIRVGLDAESDGLGGAGWFDYNNDNLLDLFIANGTGYSNGLFRNNGDGTFTDIASKAGVANGRGNSGIVVGDINNDGCSDMYLTGEGGIEVIGDMSNNFNVLYLNNCDGTFEDITYTSGAVGPATGWSAAFSDINNDGYLDLFIGSPGAKVHQEQHGNKLYLNNGDLTFTDISREAGIDTKLGACAVGFSDYNFDGLSDIFVANCNEVAFNPSPMELFRNNGDLTFTNVADEVGFSDPGFWMSVSFADYDNDGKQDLFSTNLGDSIPQKVFRHGLFKNNGDGTYTDVGVEMGLSDWEFGWGSSFADIDNDGFPDILFTGSLPPDPFHIVGRGSGNPGRLFMNEEGKEFSLVATYGLHNQFTSGLATGDFDNNGFPDIVMVTSDFLRSEGRPLLLQNPGNDNNWITIETIGTRSNRDGVGALVEVTTEGSKQIKEVHAGSSFLSADSPWLTFGLGTKTNPSVEILWPSGLREAFGEVDIRELHSLTEGSGQEILSYNAGN